MKSDFGLVVCVFGVTVAWCCIRSEYGLVFRSEAVDEFPPYLKVEECSTMKGILKAIHRSHSPLLLHVSDATMAACVW